MQSSTQDKTEIKWHGMRCQFANREELEEAEGWCEENAGKEDILIRERVAGLLSPAIFGEPGDWGFREELWDGEYFPEVHGVMFFQDDNKAFLFKMFFSENVYEI